MDLATLSIGPDTSDNDFIKAVNNIPNKTIFVIEDIDSLFARNQQNLVLIEQLF